jgi:PII-like signaling protein
MNSLLRIVVGEYEFNSNSRNVYKDIREFLWKEGFQGVTVRRGELSLDHKSAIHSVVLEDIQFNDLAIIIESVVNNDKIEKVKQDIIKMIPHGQVSVIRGMEEKDMEIHKYFVVKVYTKEDNSWFKKEEYEKVLEFFKKKKVIWTTVTKGIVGYGKDRVVHKQKIFSFSEKMPIVVECIVPSEKLQDLLDELKNIVEEGAVFTTPIDLIINK